MLTISYEELRKERNFFYKNLYLLYKHLISGSWHYLQAIDILSEKKYKLNLPRNIDDEIDVSIDELNLILMDLSDLLVALSKSIVNEDLEVEKEKIEIYNGRIIDIKIWQYFLQHITHQTHHQGQISMIFDELEIEHEFGNIFPLLEDAL